MTASRWERWACASGIGFVVAVLAGFAMAPEPPKLSDPAASLAAYFSQHQSAILVQVLVAAGMGGVFLLWWLGSLRLHLRRHETDGGRLSAVAFGSGLVGLAILIQVLAIRAALAFGLSGTVDPAVFKAIFAVSYTVDALNVFPIGALLVAASISALRSRALPAWIGWFGLSVGLARWVTGLDVVLKESVLGDEGAIGRLVFVSVMVWIVAASIAMMRSAPVEGASAAHVG